MARYLYSWRVHVALHSHSHSAKNSQNNPTNISSSVDTMKVLMREYLIYLIYERYRSETMCSRVVSLHPSSSSIVSWGSSQEYSQWSHSPRRASLIDWADRESIHSIQDQRYSSRSASRVYCSHEIYVRYKSGRWHTSHKKYHSEFRVIFFMWGL